MNLREVSRELDKIADTIESQDPRIALAIDQISDNIDHIQYEMDKEAGLKEIGEKAKELGGKAKNLILNKVLPLVTGKLKGYFKKIIDRFKSVIFKRSGIAMKLVQGLIAKAPIDPKVKAELQRAVSGKDAVVAIKKLNQLQKNYPVEGEDKEKALEIAKRYRGNLKSASMDVYIEAGILDFLKKPSVLVTASIAILLMAVGSPEAAETVFHYLSPEVDPASLNFWGLTDVVMSGYDFALEKVVQSGDIVEHVQQFISASFSRDSETLTGKPLHDILSVIVRDGDFFKDISAILPPGTESEDVAKILQEQLKGKPEIIENIMSNLKI
jgi:hypothetical protein